MVSWLLGIAVFLFFLMTILIYWIFGFKYWVISNEVPRFLDNSEEYKRKCSETTYSIINFFAFGVIFLTCGFAGYFRGVQASQYANGNPSD